MLEIGNGLLGVRVAVLARVESGDYLVREAVAPAGFAVAPGARLELERTYCRDVVGSGEPLAVDRAHETGWSEHPCYRAYRIETYVGAPIVVGGEVWGTLSFSDPKARPEPFGPADRALVQMMAGWAARAIEEAEAPPEEEPASGVAPEGAPAEDPDAPETDADEPPQGGLADAVLDAIPAPIVATDGDGRILGANPAAERLLGEPIPELVGRELAAVVDPLPVEREVREVHLGSEALYAVLLHEASPEAEIPAEPDRSAEEVREAEGRAAAAEGRAAAAEARATEAEKKAAAAEERASEAEERITAADERASEAEERITAADEDATEAKERAAAAEEGLIDARERAVAAEDRLAEAKERAVAAEDRLAEEKDRAATAEDRLAEAQERATTAEERLAEAEERVATAEERSNEADERAGTVDDRLAEAQERAASAEKRAAEAAERVAVAEERLAEAEKHLTVAGDRAVAAEKRANTAQERASEVAEELAATDRELNEVREELERVRSAREEATLSGAEGAERELTSVRLELEDTREELERARSAQEDIILKLDASQDAEAEARAVVEETARELAEAKRALDEATSRPTAEMPRPHQEESARELADAMRELEDLRRRADRATRSRTELLARVNREIRTPLTAILGYSEELLDVPDEAVRSNAGVVHDSGRLLLRMVEDIVDFSRLEAGDLKISGRPTSAARVLTEVCRQYEPVAAEKGLRLRTDIAGPMPEAVATDPVRLAQIMTNLVDNAVRFTEQGAVHVRLRHEPKSSGTGRPEDHVCDMLMIEVADTGIGMTPEEQNLVLGPIAPAGVSQTRRPGGTGLGLAIVRRLAKLFGGDLEMESEPGRGSCFRVRIHAPATRGAPDAAPFGGADTAANGSAAGLERAMIGSRVLVVGEDDVNRRLFERILEKAGADVASVPNGRAALARCAESPPDIVLTDVHVPEVDGYELTRRLREEGFAGRIVALTASATEEDRRRCEAAGFDAFCPKPIPRDRLVRTLRDQLGTEPQVV
jgi:signal transduction histidine kinase/PAS domain-containing protein